jgi:hypothetical protein
MKYKNHQISRSATTTDTAHGIKNVYEINGRHGKRAAARPFLTSVAACRRYITEQIELEAAR